MGLSVSSNVFLRNDVDQYNKAAVVIATIVYFVFWPLFYIAALGYILKNKKPLELLYTAMSVYCILYVLIQGIVAMI